MSHDVFISYATDDLKIVEATCDFLEKNGIRCWYAKRDLPLGDSSNVEITSEIDQSKVIVLIHTINSDNSEEVFREIHYVTYLLPKYESKQIPIIPYKIGNFLPSKRIAFRLCDIQSIYTDIALKQEDLSRLSDSVKMKIGINITPSKINIQNRLLYRLFLRSIRDGLLLIWIIDGINDINKQKQESESIVSLMGAVILDFSIINKDGNTEMSNEFKELMSRSGGIDLLNNLKNIEKSTINYVLTNLSDKPIKINYSKKLDQLHLNPQIEQYGELSPLNLKLFSNPDIILTGGDTSLLTAQLYFNGVPFIMPGVVVIFSIDNDSLGYLPTVATTVTNSNGQAQILLTSKEYPGTITVFAEASINGRLLRNKTTITSTTWGSIIGKVYDKNRNGIPNAIVKLWRSKYNEDKKVYERTTLYPSPENPQQSRGMITPIGSYIYYRIPIGSYQITAEKSDASGNSHMGFSIINVLPGSNCSCVIISDLVLAVPSKLETKK